MTKQPKYGARVYPLDESTILIKQTIKRGSKHTDQYVIEDPILKERHVKLTDLEGIGRAVQAAIAGNLREKMPGII